MRLYIQHLCKLTHRLREQARSHRVRHRQLITIREPRTCPYPIPSAKAWPVAGPPTTARS
ncbi:hypothetical protein DZG01_23900 [Pseudomonas fluorescens]|nr:hypothetical protein DZG01_23900 [Pseudomonas fluorescens]